MQYRRLTRTTDHKGILIPTDESVYPHIKDDSDWYLSIFKYSETHKQKFDEIGSIAGITDVMTDKLVWDFDSEKDVDAAKSDALSLCTKLLNNGVEQDNIRVYFSGNKGFHVEVKITKDLTVDEFKNINLRLAEGLATNDKQILNASRILRINRTKHQKTGLYKYPLTVEELGTLSIKDIRSLAATNQVDRSKFSWSEQILPEAIYSLRLPKVEIKKVAVDTSAPSDIDFTSKMKFLSNCKHALLNGYFKEGNRSNALMALASTFKNMGIPYEINGRMLKGAAELAAKRYGGDDFSKKEIWENIVSQVYKPTWKGGHYSCKTEGWLKDICESLGPNKCRHINEESMGVMEIGEKFRNYALHIDKNLIRTGLTDVDEKARLSVGMTVGILGCPGSAKTTLALNILKNVSKEGIKASFFSMDMYNILVLQKLLHMYTGLSAKQLYDLSKNEAAYNRAISQIAEDYKNVNIYSKSGYTVQDIRTLLIEEQEKIGSAPRLVVIDYLECLQGPYSDSTANTSLIANQLKDLASELNTCIMVLVQPQKSAGDPSRPLTSMRQIKGSSTLEQAFSVILGVHREGFSADHPEEDRFITISALKNRMGMLFKRDYSWNGLRGTIGELTQEDENELFELKEIWAQRRQAQSDGNGLW